MRSATKSSRILSASELPSLYSVWLAGAANGVRTALEPGQERVWYAVLEAPRIAVTSTLHQIYAIAEIARAMPQHRRTHLISADGVMCFTRGFSIAGLTRSLRMGFLLGSVIVRTLFRSIYRRW